MTTEPVNTLKTKMENKEPFILINSDVSNVYRVLTQTSNELPAHDMGLNKIQFDPEAVKNGLSKLVGTFVYDETQSNHNRRLNPEMRGRKVAKIVNEGYCPTYGAYTDWEIFDPEFEETMKQALDNHKRGLPVHEGPSTELDAHNGVKYGDNNLRVTDLTYNGLVWTDNPRDKGLGVCSVVNNSILNIKEDKSMVDKLEIEREEYDALKQIKIDKEQLEQEKQDLQAKYDKGLELYNAGKTQFNELKGEKEDLYNQLVPIWTKQGEKKVAMVNSIMETIPEAEKEAKQKIYDSMTIEQLGVIVNSLPTDGSQRGIQNGGVGSGRQTQNPDEYTAEKFKEDYKAAYGEELE